VVVPVIGLLPFIIGSNIGRVWFYALPVVIPLAVAGLRPLLDGYAARTLARAEPSPPRAR
jgi:hypothetical protein